MEMKTNKIKDHNQIPVQSNKAPKIGGPLAASKYPIDCDMPESAAASKAFLVRKEKNMMHKLKAIPIAIPKRMAEGKMNRVFPNINPANAEIIKINVIHTSSV